LGGETERPKWKAFGERQRAMLTRLHAKGFKSLIDLEVEFPQLTVLFGPNASGKSNILEAAQVLSLIGTSGTVSEALADSHPLRGRPLELFAFPRQGLPGLLREPTARFSLEADLGVEAERLRYRVGVEIRPATGSLAVYEEYLARTVEQGEPVIHTEDDRVYLRARHGVAQGAWQPSPAQGASQPGQPTSQGTRLDHALVSDRRLGGTTHDAIDSCRRELEGWRTYYLDPRTSMRSAQPLAEVRDIGVAGSLLAPYLHRLKVEHPKLFGAVKRTLRSLVPAVEDLDVDLDERRGELNVQVRQDGCEFSSRIISEGTLRVLALCAIAVNPWAKGLVAFEEPENGVHPRRLELIAELLVSSATQDGRQVIVTTHSPLFCAAVLGLAKAKRDKVAVLNVRRDAGGTQVGPIEFRDSLLQDQELLKGLSSPTEDGLFQGLLMRGLLDE
jgi:predicted ATPase